MKPTIEHPHIFISYAWGTEENQQKVLEFATSLVRCGIEVELDKWSLKEGNDTYAYMEQMVNNPKITNVLILLDQNYAEKADARKGGVGTETQILSPEIYEKVQQDKFIPVVFKRGNNGEIFKPSFLKSLLHFDLSLDERYATEFQRLVKRLFGIEIYERPELGSPPDWLTKKEQSVDPRITFAKVLNTTNDNEKQFEIRSAFSNIKDDVITLVREMDINGKNIIDCYKELQKSRDSVLSLITFCLWQKSIGVEISTFLEDLKNTRLDVGTKNDTKDSFVHEIFIYIVGILFKSKNYEQLGYLLNKTYFSWSSFDDPTSFNHFYINNAMLDQAVCLRDNKRYHSGTAQLWVETIDMNYLSRSDFVAADVLLHNVAVFGKNYEHHWLWYPISYVYDDSNSKIRNIGKRLSSKEFLNAIECLFGFIDVDSFIDSIKIKAKEMDSGARYRYSGAWHEVPLITDGIKMDDIGKYN